MSTPGSTRLVRTLRFALLLAGMAWLPLSQAQVAPTAAETAAYRGLHAAAARGDVATLTQLLSAKADINQRDAYGRTPLHVATFAKQRAAVRALDSSGR